MQNLLRHIEQTLSEHFHQRIHITQHQQVFGGDINQTFRLQTNNGLFFLKLNDGSLKDMFGAEFKGLQLLDETKTIKIPKPVLYGSYGKNVMPAKAEIPSNEKQVFLITEFIQRGKPSGNFWQSCAQQLAALHKISHAQFGLSNNNYIGSLPQQNDYCATWNEFYASRRIMPLMELAFNQHKCSKEDLKLSRDLCKRLHDFFPVEKPALIHGDLWGGNFMSNENGEPVIYDPAVYYGNREMDIAMSLLFGGFDKQFYAYYNECFPLQPGWHERVQLCQLYPLLVHLILFGGHYYSSVINVLRHYS